MSDIYQRQVAPTRATDTLPFAREETFGGELGRAIGRAGDVVGQVNVQNRQLQVERERDMQASAAALQFVRIQEEAAKRALELQDESEPGGAGYTAAIDGHLGEQETAFLGSIGDEKVRRRFQERFAEWRADTSLRAEAWERGQAVKLTVNNNQQATHLRANRAARLDGDGFAAELAAFKEDIAGLEHVPPDVRAALERDGVTEISVSWIGSRPPEERIALLKSGVFDQLDPGIVKQLQNEAEVDQRRAQLELESQARIAKADAKDSVDAVLADLGDGIPRSDDEIKTALELARKNGLDDEARKLEKGFVENAANREFTGASEVQIDREVKRLNTVIANAGDKAKPEDIWRRDHLVTLRDKRGEQLRTDAADFASQNGIEWGELDIADPASIAARRKAVQQTEALTGRPASPLLPAEVEQLQANLGSAEGQRAAVAVARQFGGRYAAAAMRQIAPNDPLMLHATGLTSHVAAVALQGRATIKSKAYVPPKALDDTFRTVTGRALNGLAPEARGGVLETARAIYAYYADRDGLPSEEAYESLAKQAVNMALGQTEKGRGGLGSWRGNAFVLPPAMTWQQFGGRIANLKVLDGMYWGDHETKVTPEQLRTRFTPVRISGTSYAWLSDDGRTYAVTKQGQKAALDVGALPDPKPAAAAPAPARPRSAAVPGADYRARPTTGGRRPVRRPISPYEKPGK